MANKKYRPDYGHIYPGVFIPDEVLTVLKKSDRKMEYMEYDLKAERPLRDKEGLVIAISPSREDSFERLLEQGKQFLAEALMPEQIYEAQEEVNALHRCLSLLSKDEQSLIRALFFEGLTEREYAAMLGLSKTSIHARKLKVIKKLKKSLGVYRPGAIPSGEVSEEV